MGAHQKAPSMAISEKGPIALDKLISADPEFYLGAYTSERFQARLPYLFKVLDVDAMLSIQVHPSKSEAEKGFEKENQVGIPLTAKHRNYRDDNHKPEIMLALTDFWLLHGFKDESSLIHILERYDAFHFLLPILKEHGIKAMYQMVMEMEQEKVNEHLQPLMIPLADKFKRTALEKGQPEYWAAKAYLNSNLPEGDIDRGIFSIFFFNLVFIPEGKGIFQDAGIPHAYLEGVNVELMANSDNVLRGGLTPKHIDVPELLKHTRFEAVDPMILEGEFRQGGEKVFKSAAPDFELSEISLKTSEEYVSPDVHGPDICLVFEGEISINAGKEEMKLAQGEVCFIAANQMYQIITHSPSARLFKASVPLITEMA